MSTLLDVLHKRSPRSQSAAIAAADEPKSLREDVTMDLGLAPETESMPDTGSTTGDIDPTIDLTGELARRAPPGDTTAMQRWSDSAPAAASRPAAVAQPTTRRRLPVLVAILVAAALAVGFVVSQFTGGSQESFLAVPVEADMAEQPVEQPAEPQPAAPAATDEAPPEAIVGELTEAQDEWPAAEASTDVAWYDQPALPENAAPEPVIRITRSVTTNPLFAKLREAHTALIGADAARAESLYREVLAADQNSVDALLGLATLAARGARTEEARDLYLRVQQLDPQNGTAMAALAALPGQAGAPGTESRLKNLLREQPGAAPLHFAHGLQYVAEQRWPDAQIAFFEAVRHDPANADYAFNLAVSLDRLGQSRAAASYYQRAVELASGARQFDVEAARARLAILRGERG
jgi:tetratricopeptide (TPR) repeat protein